MDKIDRLNPYFSFRTGQKEAIQDILQAAENGAKVVQLDAGVGSGKSLILTITAKLLAGHWANTKPQPDGDRPAIKAIYTTPQVKLVEQLRQDEHLRIPALVGKANYPCCLPDFSADMCPLSKAQRALLCPQCEYEAAKKRFNKAVLGAITLDKLLYDKSLQSPDILVVDESSGLEARLINHSEILLPANILPENLEEGLTNWLSQVMNRIEALQERQSELSLDMQAPNPETLLEARKIARDLQAEERKVSKIEYILDTVQSEDQGYVIDKENKFRTIDGKKQFNKLIWYPRITILASGTPCPQMIASEYTTVSMPNPIPADKRLVYYDPVGKMSAAHRENTIDKMAPKIAELHKEHCHNTLIHCHSYKVAADLGNAIMDYDCRVVVQDKMQDKEETIRSWMKGDDTILASVGCEEGLDLNGPKFPLNIVCVVPFPFRGDEWVLKREEHDKKNPAHKQYGIMSTAIALQQAVGRTTRGPDDFSKSYILDANFGWFVRRYRAAFKTDFLRSVMVTA
jgi:Rad3-related DNA helicase